MLKVSRRSRWRRWVPRWRCTLASRSRVRLMASPIMRRSSSICVSPGPPRVPMPPRWRSRWDQRRTSRVLRYCSRASSTCSLPSWRARTLGEDLEDEEGAVVHRDAELALEVALLRRAQRLVEDHLAGVDADRPVRGSRRPCRCRRRAPRRAPCVCTIRRATGSRPAVCASRPSSSSSPSKWGNPKSTPTRTTAPSFREFSSDKRNQLEKARRANRRAPCDQAAASSFSAAEKLTARPGTMVEMACL